MKVIRTERWPLAATQAQKAMVAQTLSLYRAYVRALMGVIYTHWPTLADQPDVVKRVEALIHPTAKRPAVKYRYFQRRFYKFPSYYRRVAIMDAYGQVQSFISRQNRWLDDERRTPHERPPRLQVDTRTFPSLYKGQCIRYQPGMKAAAIKLYNGSDWIWSILQIRHTGKRAADVRQKALSPLLVLHNNRVLLNVPHQQDVTLSPKQAQVVCAVDVGINTTATASIVRADGTVLARRFFHRAKDIDRMHRRLRRIRRKAGQTKRMGKGFCAGLYRKAYNLAKNHLHHITRELVDWAKGHGAETVVFEHLKGWRPRGGKKRSGLRRRFHTWMHRRLVEYTTWKWHEQGGRLAFVSPRGTSKYAFDGSGEVRRDRANAQWVVFSSGKRYNADLNASYNIAAKYFHRAIRENGRTGPGKSSRPVPGTPVTLSVLWQQRAA